MSTLKLLRERMAEHPEWEWNRAKESRSEHALRMIKLCRQKVATLTLTERDREAFWEPDF